MGQTLIVSLANTVHSQATKGENVRLTTRALEWAGIDWLGVHAKTHHIFIMGTGEGQRAGILAFCGVQKKCTDTPNLAFSPVKYSTKLAKSAIDELNEVCIMLNVRVQFIESSILATKPH